MQFKEKFSFILLLSMVSCAYSCSSFTGWRDNKPHKASPPIIVERKCPNGLDKEFCQNGGNCVMRLEPTCVCASGWTGIRCMQKETDGTYNVKVNQTPELTTTTTASAEASSTQNPDLELIKVPADQCQAPYDKEFCLNGGTCRYLGHGIGYICLCEYPFVGKRCEEKGLDGSYQTVNRQRRDISSGKKNKRKIGRSRWKSLKDDTVLL